MHRTRFERQTLKCAGSTELVVCCKNIYGYDNVFWICWIVCCFRIVIEKGTTPQTRCDVSWNSWSLCVGVHRMRPGLLRRKAHRLIWYTTKAYTLWQKRLRPRSTSALQCHRVWMLEPRSSHPAIHNIGTYTDTKGTTQVPRELHGDQEDSRTRSRQTIC